MTGNCSANCPPQIIRRRRMKLKKHTHLQSPAHKARCSQLHLNLEPQLWYIPDPQYSSSLLFAIQHISQYVRFSYGFRSDRSFVPGDGLIVFCLILPQANGFLLIPLDLLDSLSLFSVTTQSAHQLIGLVCRLYSPPLAFRCWMICR
jgi:hypothetical protein